MRIALALVTLLSGTAGVLQADGGTVQLQKTAGPFVITVFSEPVPVRVGRVDLSVMCQRLDTKTPVLDASVLLHLRRPGGGDILEFTLPARHAAATNHLLYAASANVPSPGVWQLSVDVQQGKVLVSAYGNLRVLDQQPPLAVYWPYFAMVPLVVLLFGVNRWLRRGRDARYRRAQL